jgi:acetoin utilization protein AcuB
MKVRDWMTPEPETVDRFAPLAEAIAIMQELGVRQVPVVDGHEVVGILTDRDLRLLLGIPASEEGLDREERPEFERPVTQFMTRGLVTVSENLDLAEACRILAELRVGSLPVVDEDGRLSGILSVTDVLKAAAILLERSSG